MFVLTGKAGGFLALDWTDELARVSYALHQDLAATFTDMGYRPVQSMAVSARAFKKASIRRRASKLPDWHDGNVSGGQVWLRLLLVFLLGQTMSACMFCPSLCDAAQLSTMHADSGQRAKHSAGASREADWGGGAFVPFSFQPAYANARPCSYVLCSMCVAALVDIQL